MRPDELLFARERILPRPDGGGKDIGADAMSADIVDIPEVVTEVKLVEPERNGELGPTCGEIGSAVELDGEAWSEDVGQGNASQLDGVAETLTDIF